jgi:hypothetical protein
MYTCFPISSFPTTGTNDTCDENTQSCQFITDDTQCSDGLDCTVDTCDATEGCRHVNGCDDSNDCKAGDATTTATYGLFPHS